MTNQVAFTVEYLTGTMWICGPIAVILVMAGILGHVTVLGWFAIAPEALFLISWAVRRSLRAHAEQRFE